MEDRIINVKDVCEICKCQKNKAYEIIKLCNRQLEKQGYITFSKGRTTYSMLVKLLGLNVKIDN